MDVVNDVMTMRPVKGGLEIPPGGAVELKPGGLHIMFLEVSRPFNVGETVPVTLEFERAGSVEIAFPVHKAQGGGHDHHSGHSEDHGSLPDRDAIEQVLKATWDRPEAPLTVMPVVIESDHAIAGWMQEDRGGHALLRRSHGEWRVHLCTGDAVKDAAKLRQMGVPDVIAVSLAQKLGDAEMAMPPDHVAQLSSFDGTVMMDGHGKH